MLVRKIVLLLLYCQVTSSSHYDIICGIHKEKEAGAVKYILKGLGVFLAVICLLTVLGFFIFPDGVAPDWYFFLTLAISAVVNILFCLISAKPKKKRKSEQKHVEADELSSENDPSYPLIIRSELQGTDLQAAALLRDINAATYALNHSTSVHFYLKKWDETIFKLQELSSLEGTANFKNAPPSYELARLQSNEQGYLREAIKRFANMTKKDLLEGKHYAAKWFDIELSDTSARFDAETAAYAETVTNEIVALAKAQTETDKSEIKQVELGE